MILFSAISMQGCSNTHISRIDLASCASGTLRLQQFTRTNAFLGERSSSIRQDLYYHPRSRPPIAVQLSKLRSYRSSAADRLVTFRAPQTDDWHLYVAPAKLHLRDYENLSSCIRENLDEIHARMSTDAAARGPAAKKGPRIATLRHVALEELRREYRCATEGILRLQENGLIYLDRHNSVLIGAVIEGGKKVVLNQSALAYLARQEDRPIPAPTRYIQACVTSSATSLFQEFEVLSAPQEIFWAAAHGLPATLPPGYTVSDRT